MDSGNKGYTLVEVMVSVLILAIFCAGGYTILASGRAAWSTAETNIAMQDSLRKSFAKLTVELRQSDTTHVQISDGTGPNSSDVIRFSVPIICHAGDNLIDTNGDVAHWGAPLTWGCTASTCMDANDDCSSTEYALVEYRINNGKLVRRVLTTGGTVVVETTVAEDITDFQVTLASGVAHPTVTARQKSASARTLTTSIGEDVFLRN
jgi:prepilin-type N-terminal cleavage/methylation domain-containing protein